MESDASLEIQRGVRASIYDLVWSYMNDFENSSNPHEAGRKSIQEWKHRAKEFCDKNDEILKRGEEIQRFNIKPKDALHLACAIESKCDYFISTDYSLVRKAALFSEISVVNPTNFIFEMEEHYHAF
jgi:predicted nucleic acid-binding protein